MNLIIIYVLMCIIAILIAAIIIWMYDLHELFIKEKRANRIRMIQTDAQKLAKEVHGVLQKLAEFWKKLSPYILCFLKWLLHLAGMLFCLAVKLLKWLIQKLKEKLQDMEDHYHQVNPALLLTIDESLELVKTLSGHPYESPVLENMQFDHYVAVSYSISAAGKAPRYTDMKPDEFDRIVIQKVREFLAEKRKVPSYVRIIASTPTYLHFVVTYTNYGMNRLMQIYPPLQNAEPQTTFSALEEAIPEEETGQSEEREPWF